MKVMIAVLLLACCTLVAVAEETGDLRLAGPPGEYQLLLENESVQVLRIRIAPREKAPMHDVTPRVVLWLADAHFVDRFPDGTTREEIRKAGEVEWVSARRHAGENVADTPMEFVAVVLKSLAAVTGAPEYGRTTPH